MSLLIENKLSLKERLENLNWKLVLLIFLLSISGLLMLFSAAGGEFKPWLVRQIIYISVFLPLMSLVAITDIKFWFKICYFGYFVGIILLAIVDIKGHNSMGATRWVKIAGITIQPSEMTKLFTVMALAKYFYTIEADNIQKTSYFIIPLLIIFTPALLILDQPDLGTAMIVVLAGASVLFVAGVRAWKFIAGGILALIAIPFLWFFVLYDYQKNRVLTFLNPDADPSGAGYNIIQSKIAIGSGGFFGKGYLNGTQGQLDFLPERQTDFIFTMLSEELGFVGSISIIILFLLIIREGSKISIKSKNQFSKLLAAGIINIFFLQMFINMGMVTGILPVVGIPLPLISYGGTMAATILIAFGLLLNIDLHHNTESRLS